jgi:hypothetical protein
VDNLSDAHSGIEHLHRRPAFGGRSEDLRMITSPRADAWFIESGKKSQALLESCDGETRSRNRKCWQFLCFV